MPHTESDDYADRLAKCGPYHYGHPLVIEWEAYIRDCVLRDLSVLKVEHVQDRA